LSHLRRIVLRIVDINNTSSIWSHAVISSGNPPGGIVEEAAGFEPTLNVLPNSLLDLDRDLYIRRKLNVIMLNVSRLVMFPKQSRS
jgi:hypothetical protein